MNRLFTIGMLIGGIGALVARPHAIDESDFRLALPRPLEADPYAATASGRRRAKRHLNGIKKEVAARRRMGGGRP